MLCAIASVASAQKITHTFQDNPLSEALKYIQAQATDYNITFIYDELEDFRVTTHIRNKSVPEAILQIVGFYPVRVVKSGKHEIYVECTHKTERHLTGTIIDEQGQPVVYANIAVLTPADSTLLSGGVSNESGYFVVPIDQPNIIARISYIGYKTIYKQCDNTELGTIRMQPDTQTLGEVVVKGERPQYKMTTGGMTIDIQNSLLKDFAKGKPEIYINNKKVQNARELKQLKSTDIKSVDVITSPGARYNAEVGAVIRIKTKKHQGDGISVEAYSQVVYNEKWTTYDDATVKYRTGGLEVFGVGVFQNNNHSEDNTISTDTRANGNLIHISQYAPNSFWYTNLSGKVGGNYDLNDSTSLGMTYELSGSPYESGDAHTTQTILRNGKQEGTISQYMSRKDKDGPSHEANVYFIGKLGRLGIDFNGSCLWNESSIDMLSQERSDDLPDCDVTTHSERRSHMLAGKLVLTYPIWRGELSAGTEMTHSNSHGIYNNVEQIVRSSDDEIKESNMAGFAEYHLRLDNWSIGAGLRYEAVTSDYYSFGQYQTEPSRKYHDLFPNLSVGWQKNKWGIQLSYNKRISRPSYYQLDSNIQYDNRYEYEGGNPLLRPTIKQNFDLNVTYSWLNFTAGYSHNKDIRLSFGDLFQEGTEITMWTSRNFDKFESYNAALTASPKFGFYSPTLTLSYFQQQFDTQTYGNVVSLDKPQFEVNFRNWFTIGKTAKAMLYLHYSTSHDYGFNHYAHEFNINARVQKTFLDGNLTAALFANDIFRNLRERWTGYYPVTTMVHSHMTSTPHVASIKELVQVTQKRAVYNSLSLGQLSAFVLALPFH